MIAMVIVSLVAIGITTVYFFKFQNDEYHFKRIQRKQKTVNLSLEYFLNDLSPDEVDDFVSRDFDLKVHEIAKVNSLIIHVFNTKGEELINTEPRDSVFKNSRLDPFLLYKLESAKDGKYVEKKENGSINSYSFAKNKKGENMVVINIPYNPLNFTAKTEVNLFLKRLIEVFLVLFTGALLIAYLLTRYITKSIEEVRKKIEVVEINETNEKLIWEKKDEIGVLVNAYNKMIDKLEISKKKLAQNERQTAWREMAKQIAHEIKNPLTPIQLSIDSLREKYKNKLNNQSQEFEKYLETINRQIQDIEKLVNEFSNFARMPRPILKRTNISNLTKKSLDFIKMSSKNSINLKVNTEDLFIKGDEDQLNRALINLIKNSEEAFMEMAKKKANFKGIIDIEIDSNNDYIVFRITDNGPGITDAKKAMTPYFTTKKTGTGLGLPIVTKIINEHSGNFSIRNKKEGNGTVINILLPKANA